MFILLNIESRHVFLKKAKPQSPLSAVCTSMYGEPAAGA